MTRYIAHVIFETKTPLKVGSNKSDFLQDAPIQKDWNGLPMILGTSLGGVFRKGYRGDKNKIFGDEDSHKKDAKGSKVIFSNALLVNEEGKVYEELLTTKTPFLQLFDNLVIREHTAITAQGVAKDKSKFDEEVLFKGSRFKFSIELQDSNKEEFETLLNRLAEDSFRIGSGSTKGFGAINVLEITTAAFDETNYDEYSSSLNSKLPTSYTLTCNKDIKYDSYKLILKPDDFFMFGSGFGDDEADMTPVYEQVIDYEHKTLSKKKVLIPASSIKGAIAHRSTFYYNEIEEKYIGDDSAFESLKEIFGEAKNSKEKIDGSKGKVLFSDCYLEKSDTKVFDHVAIDRFTGGAIDGALFQEKTATTQEQIILEILLEKGVEKSAQEAFEKALQDIASGMLPLGGATTKGHGIFSGKVFKNGEQL